MDDVWIFEPKESNRLYAVKIRTNTHTNPNCICIFNIPYNIYLQEKANTRAAIFQHDIHISMTYEHAYTFII